MPIDPARALAAAPRRTEITWDRKDVQLYHLGVGAGSGGTSGTAATDPAELRYTLESGGLHVLPSFATVAGAGPGVVGELATPGIDVDLAAVLHGGHRLTLHRPVPVRGAAVQTCAVTAVHDKGTAALIELRAQTADTEGPLWSSDFQLFVRGEGGFGGTRGTSVRLPPPEGEPDRVVTRGTRPDQALLYRLSGDLNPLHADPAFARRAGFDRPVLHGLCTYGIALKAVVDTLLDGDVARVRSYAARFTGVVFPGETLRVSIWRERPGRIRLTATLSERPSAPPVLADATVEHDAS